MKKNLKIKNDESMYKWIERISPEYVGCSLEELRDLLSEVSKTGYIHGVRASQEIYEKYH